MGIAKTSTPETNAITRTTGDSWGKACVSGGTHKGYIQYPDDDSTEWHSLVNFTATNFKDLSCQVFERLCDNPTRAKDDLIVNNKAVVEKPVGAASDGTDMDAGEGTPQFSVCDCWGD